MRAIPVLPLLLFAALAFTTGGVCMKYSEGLTRPWPTALFCVLFLAGGCAQALAMRNEDMSAAYVFVLGLESVLAFVFGVLLFGESSSATRVVAVGLISVGIILLRR